MVKALHVIASLSLVGLILYTVYPRSTPALSIDDVSFDALNTTGELDGELSPISREMYNRYLEHTYLEQSNPSSIVRDRELGLPDLKCQAAIIAGQQDADILDMVYVLDQHNTYYDDDILEFL